MKKYLAKKTIVALTPFSNNGKSLARNAMNFAQKVHAGLLLLDVSKTTPNKNDTFYSSQEFIQYLTKTNHGEKPAMKSIKGNELSIIINNNHCSDNNIELVIAPVTHLPNVLDNLMPDYDINFNSTGCKFLFVTRNNELTSIKKIFYITDIRYCNSTAIESLIQLFHVFNSAIILVHLTASGLPDIDDLEANELFSTSIAPLFKYSQISLIKIKGKETVSEMEELVAAYKPSIIAMARHKHAIYERLFTSITKKEKLRYMNLPLFVFGF